jgi:hypothetical protein
MQGLDWQAVQIPLAAGLQQRADDRARKPPFLDIAKDVRFDELGGIQTRFPFDSMSTDAVDLDGNETTISEPRQLTTHGDELLLFTAAALYTWDTTAERWIQRADYHAVSVDATRRFARPGDQYSGDRAELGGIIVYCWIEAAAGVGTMHVALVDKATGATKLSGVTVTGVASPRIVALETTFQLYWVEMPSGDLVVATFSGANLAAVAANIATPFAVIAGTGGHYDVEKIPGEDAAFGAAQDNGGAAYSVFTCDFEGAVLDATKARTVDHRIAVAVTPDGTKAQIIRSDGTDVEGDLVNVATRADIHTGQAIATGIDDEPDAITAAYSSTGFGSSQFTCHAFWHSAESSFGSISETNTVATDNTIGTAALFVRDVGIASRAFAHGGRVFVFCVFAVPINALDTQPSPQNTLFLYRDDALLCAKVAPGSAGGFASEVDSFSRLPGVALVEGTTGYAWCGTERRIVPLADGSIGYSDLGPIDITVEMDSQEARRTARFGRALYIAGGEVLQYDGAKLTEVGWHIVPFAASLTQIEAGDLVAGTYAYKATWRTDNAAGERDRSTSLFQRDVTIASGGGLTAPNGVNINNVAPLGITHRDPADVVVEWWRTNVNPTSDAPSFLVTSRDPASATNPNRHVTCADTTGADDEELEAVHDELADVDLANLPTNDENGGILENFAPPPAKLIHASDTRLFLAGIAGEPNLVLYSRGREADVVAQFNDALRIDVPIAGGSITALATLTDTLIVFRERAVYAFPGLGLDEFALGQNYGPARTIALDVGAVSQEAVCLTDQGLVFKSHKGWMLFGGGSGARYIGAAIADYDSEEVVAVHVLEDRHEIRVLTTARMLVLDTVAEQWGERTIVNRRAAALWGGRYVTLGPSGAAIEAVDFSSMGDGYGLDVETAWIKPSDLQGFVRCRRLIALGEWRGTHQLRIRVAYDYLATYVDDFVWSIDDEDLDPGDPEQVQFGPSRQQFEAIKVRLTAIGIGGEDEFPAPTTEALKLTGLALEIGVKRGLYRRLGEAQKAGS